MKSGHRSLKKSRTNRRYVLIGLVLLACLGLIAIIVFLSRNRPWESLEQRIAAINARRALPPEENAATIYDQLAASNILTSTPGDPNLTPAGLAALIEASKMDSCWFTLSPGRQCYMNHLRRVYPMREWARALANAVRQDVANGHIEIAAEKLHCLIQMGDHLQQQALLIDFTAGTGIEGRAWTPLGEFVMQPDATEELLSMAEAMPWELENNYREVSKLTLEVQPLVWRTISAEWTLRQRVENRWRARGEKSNGQRTEEAYLRLLSQRRGARLLLGLRRYHNANGRWPDGLEEIRTLVPEQALIDPYTEQRFMYRREAGEFLLYSKGPNRRDDNGLHNEKAGDFQIWLPRHMISPQPTDREAQ
jgi:hypothetical protein